MDRIATVTRTIEASPIRPAYQALCADIPGSPREIVVFNGRQCFIEGDAVRVRVRKGWSYHNRVIIRYVDDGSAENVPVGQFNKGARRP